MEKKYDVVKFVDNEFELEVRTDKENDTVWLSQKEIGELFDVSTDNVGLHIINDGELDFSTTEDFSVVQLVKGYAINDKRLEKLKKAINYIHSLIFNSIMYNNK